MNTGRCSRKQFEFSAKNVKRQIGEMEDGKPIKSQWQAKIRWLNLISSISHVKQFFFFFGQNVKQIVKIPRKVCYEIDRLQSSSKGHLDDSS